MLQFRSRQRKKRQGLLLRLKTNICRCRKSSRLVCLLSRTMESKQELSWEKHLARKSLRLTARRKTRSPQQDQSYLEKVNSRKKQKRLLNERPTWSMRQKGLSTKSPRTLLLTTWRRLNQLLSICQLALASEIRTRDLLLWRASSSISEVDRLLFSWLREK